MKTIGIIGGMSYESSLHYYERINRQVNDVAGGLTCAKLIVYNVNFEEIHELMLKDDWNSIGEILGEVAKKLESVGADYLVIATNTIHKVANIIQNYISIPLIHISDCVSEKCKESNISYLGLLGTKYSMCEDFLKDRLMMNGLNVITPDNDDEIEEINRIIFDELCKGIIKDCSKKYYVDVINKMIQDKGIKGVIFGCTEIEMLVKQSDLNIPIFDTTQSHIDCIVDYALEKRECKPLIYQKK